MMAIRIESSWQRCVFSLLALAVACEVSPARADDRSPAELRARRAWTPVPASNQPPQPLRDPADWPQPVRHAPVASSRSPVQVGNAATRSQQIRLASGTSAATQSESGSPFRSDRPLHQRPTNVSEHPGDPASQNVGLLSDLFGGTLGPEDPTPTHRVIRSPELSLPKNKLSARYAETHPPHASHQQRNIGTPALIPNAKESSSWKTPYSYGYFGASGKRSWSKHTGYRDRYTQWTLE
ncbi:hypothetical protein Pla52o_08040 [Novipirellula galeiformis]|uniref:Uncharacterized protein n=2 Tax=Novipirellula galeiformis TaxID=2528004 RepID=A0A5C6CRF4_9BACT|nr:hypothetical protein Pla52o_08040 [Novipirellula galeiformis]